MDLWGSKFLSNSLRKARTDLSTSAERHSQCSPVKTPIRLSPKAKKCASARCSSPQQQLISLTTQDYSQYSLAPCRCPLGGTRNALLLAVRWKWLSWSQSSPSARGRWNQVMLMVAQVSWEASPVTIQSQLRKSSNCYYALRMATPSQHPSYQFIPYRLSLGIGRSPSPLSRGSLYSESDLLYTDWTSLIADAEWHSIAWRMLRLSSVKRSKWKRAAGMKRKTLRLPLRTISISYPYVMIPLKPYSLRHAPSRAGLISSSYCRTSVTSCGGYRLGMYSRLPSGSGKSLSQQQLLQIAASWVRMGDQTITQLRSTQLQCPISLCPSSLEQQRMPFLEMPRSRTMPGVVSERKGASWAYGQLTTDAPWMSSRDALVSWEVNYGRQVRQRKKSSMLLPTAMVRMRLLSKPYGAMCSLHRTSALSPGGSLQEIRVPLVFQMISPRRRSKMKKVRQSVKANANRDGTIGWKERKGTYFFGDIRWSSLVRGCCSCSQGLRGEQCLSWYPRSSSKMTKETPGSNWVGEYSTALLPIPTTFPLAISRIVPSPFSMGTIASCLPARRYRFPPEITASSGSRFMLT